MSILNLFKKNNKETKNPLMYTEQEMNDYETYIEENYGKIETILHEIISPDVHVDIIVVAPTKENNYYKLITMGMGTYDMNIPPQLEGKQLERAELVVYLPPNWDIKSQDIKDFWPIKWLKLLARYPLLANTFLGYGHTIANDTQNTPYAENTELCCMMIVGATNNDYQKLDLTLNGKKINFYQLFPLYKEEMEYKLENSANDLLNMFSDEDILPIVNITRKNYCKK